MPSKGEKGLKDIILILFIIAIVIVGNVISQNILKQDSIVLTEKLQELSKKLDSEDRKQEIEEIYKLWEETEKRWSIIVSHQELDLIKTSILGVKSGIETGDFEYSYEQIQNSIFLVGHIEEKTAIKWKNVF